MTVLPAEADSPIEHGSCAMKYLFSDRMCRPALRQMAGAALALAIGVALSGPAAAQSSVKILVNDQPITTFDIKTRTQMVKVFSQGREGEKAATEQLIEERLKAQEAKLRGISVSEEQVEREFAQRAAQLKLQPAQFTQAMQQAGISPTDFRRFLKTNMEWAELVRARFRAQVKISDQDVVAALGKKGGDAAAAPSTASEYMLQQIVFVVPKGAGQAVENQRKSEANAFRGRFQGCQQALESARGLNGVVVKPPVRRDELQLQDNTAAALASMQVGETTAPERTSDGFQVLAVCAKNAISGDRGEQRGSPFRTRERARAAPGTALPSRSARRRGHRIPVTRRPGVPPPLVLTLGEPGGIGPDITIAAWLRRRELTLPPFIFAGDATLLRRRAEALGVSIAAVEAAPEDAATLSLTRSPASPAPRLSRVIAGRLDRVGHSGGRATRSAHPSRSWLRARAAGVVTNPIQKKALNAIGFPFPGHTEFLGALSAELFGTEADPVMMLAGAGLRVVPLTIHIPLARGAGGDLRGPDSVGPAASSPATLIEQLRDRCAPHRRLRTQSACRRGRHARIRGCGHRRAGVAALRDEGHRCRRSPPRRYDVPQGGAGHL